MLRLFRRVFLLAICLLPLPFVAAARPVHDFACESCHKPEISFIELGHLTTNVCLQCHGDSIAVSDASNAFGSYPAGVTPGLQNSHIWSAPEVNAAAGAGAPTDPAFFGRYAVSSGLVTCSRCHDPHAAATNTKLLRLGAGSAEEICRECHAAWTVPTTHAFGSHPLLADYAAVALAQPENYLPTPTNSQQGSVQLVAGGVGCFSCHGAHFVDSDSATADLAGHPQSQGDGYLLRADGPQGDRPSELCQACHTYKGHGDANGEQVGCLVCHSGHDSSNPNYFILRSSAATSSFGSVTGLNYNTAAAIADNLKHTLWNDGIDGSADGYCEKCHGDARDIIGHSSGDICTECHAHNQPGAIYSFEGTGCAGCHLGSGDIDDYLFGNTVVAQIDQVQWNATGHGAAGFDSCYFCHGGAGHDDPGNPFRLANTAGLEGPNGVCWSCHRSDSTGFDPDNSGPLPLVNSSLKADSYHHGIKHGGANNGGKFCWDCHDPHGDGNLAMVQDLVVTSSDGITGLPLQTTAVSFSNAKTGTDYARSAAPFDGICNVCHSATAHYTATAGDGHNATSACTTCHPHSVDNPNEAFAPAGGCVDCHAGPQDNGDNIPLGGRRAAVGEFPLGNAHAHYGSELNDDACIVCHSTATHMNGTVELIDPDTGALYSFVQPTDLNNDPDLSNFCANCHDDDGATRLTSPQDPFGNGNTPPDVASKFQGSLQWSEYYGDVCFGYEGSMRPSNSHHDISDADQAFGSSKIECLDCHGAHNAAASQPVADPDNTLLAWSGSSNEFCLKCHDGGSGPQSPDMPPGVRQHTFFTPLPDPAHVPGTSCGTGMIYDCQGQCINEAQYASWIGDGVYCDDGAYGIDFNCVEFNYDGGDCAAPSFNPCLGNDCSSMAGLDSCSDYNRDPWWVGISWSNSAHGGGSKRTWPGYLLDPPAPTHELDCVSCHDPHGSYTPTNPAGNPYMIRDYVDGTGFVDDGSRYVPVPGPVWTYGTEGAVEVPVSPNGPDLTNLCSKCHAGWQGAGAFYHQDCTSCNSCHSHGRAFGENDWEGGGNVPWCP